MGRRIERYIDEYPQNLIKEIIGNNDIAINSDIIIVLNRVISVLSLHEWKIMFLRYGEHKSYNDIAAIIGKSHTRVRHIITNSIAKMSQSNNHKMLIDAITKYKYSTPNTSLLIDTIGKETNDNNDPIIPFYRFMFIKLNINTDFNNDTIAGIEYALSALPNNCRSLINMHYGLNMSLSDICIVEETSLYDLTCRESDAFALLRQPKYIRYIQYGYDAYSKILDNNVIDLQVNRLQNLYNNISNYSESDLSILTNMLKFSDNLRKILMYKDINSIKDLLYFIITNNDDYHNMNLDDINRCEIDMKLRVISRLSDSGIRDIINNYVKYHGHYSIDGMFQWDINTLGFSVRIINALYRYSYSKSITNVGELLRLVKSSDTWDSNIRNFGEKSKLEVENKLHELGLLY